jgi:hypothetical protein
MQPQIQGAPRLPVLIALSALAVLPINMFVPSLPAIAKATVSRQGEHPMRTDASGVRKCHHE